MYTTAAIFFIVATICMCVLTNAHVSKARITCSVSDKVSISAYVDKDDVDEIGDMFALSVKGLKNGSSKSY